MKVMEINMKKLIEEIDEGSFFKALGIIEDKEVIKSRLTVFY